MVKQQVFVYFVKIVIHYIIEGVNIKTWWNSTYYLFQIVATIHTSLFSPKLGKAYTMNAKQVLHILN